MSNAAPLKHGTYYHIYNRGNNGENIFRINDNYTYFLYLYDKYISLVADTYAWCLLKNHFHFLVHIKEEDEILPFSIKTSDRVCDLCQGIDVSTLSTVKDLDSGLNQRKPTPSKQFSHLFNAYVQAFNRAFNRTGCLFETPLKEK